MNKDAEKKVGKSFEELTPEEMNNVQGSAGLSWSTSSSSTTRCYSARCSYSCCTTRCCKW